MKRFIAAMVIFGAVLFGLGLITAFPIGGGGLGKEGAPGESLDTGLGDRSEGVVEIRANGFSPSTTETLGQATVTFINRDDRAHGVDFADETLEDRKVIEPGGSYSIQMPGSGRYKFSDTENPSATGTIVVPEQ